jgi:hypothetical protein
MSIVIPMRKKLSSYQPASCSINEAFLSRLGFYRVISEKIQDTKTYRYCNQHGHGFDVIFSEEFNVPTVEEFGYDDAGKTSFNNTIVGMFHIQLPEDLDFIFSRNVRLNYVFNTAKKNVVSF